MSCPTPQDFEKARACPHLRHVMTPEGSSRVCQTCTIERLESEKSLLEKRIEEIARDKASMSGRIQELLRDNAELESDLATTLKKLIELQAERQRCEGFKNVLENAEIDLRDFDPSSYLDGGVAMIGNLHYEIKKALAYPTSAVVSEGCKCCGSDLCQCDERCCKPMTQEPSPKHIIFNGRVYGLLDEGCYTMKNPVEVVEKEKEPSLVKFNRPVALTERDLEMVKTESLLVRMAEELKEHHALIVNSQDYLDDGCATCKLLAEYEQRRAGE